MVSVHASAVASMAKTATPSTLVDLHIRQRLPFVHRHNPSAALSPTTKIDHELRDISTQSIKQQAIETLLRESGVREEIRCYDDLLETPSAICPMPTPYRSKNDNKYHPTFCAPLSIHSLAFSALIPPPTCRPWGHADSASIAASSLPRPSIMTWAPASPCFL